MAWDIFLKIVWMRNRFRILLLIVAIFYVDIIILLQGVLGLSMRVSCLSLDNLKNKYPKNGASNVRLKLSSKSFERIVVSKTNSVFYRSKQSMPIRIH